MLLWPEKSSASFYWPLAAATAPPIMFSDIPAASRFVLHAAFLTVHVVFLFDRSAMLRASLRQSGRGFFFYCPPLIPQRSTHLGNVAGLSAVPLAWDSQNRPSTYRDIGDCLPHTNQTQGPTPAGRLIIPLR